ncbi:MAG: metallophosphoesterase family protein [Saccharofermentanales bacterium]
MIAIISDIHGNYPALKSVIDEIKLIGCTKIISLGDIAGYYGMINECIDLCQENKVVNILGNHDFYLISGTPCPRSTSANLCLEYQKKIISRENMSWLKQSISTLDDDIYSLRHGGWNDILDEYVCSFDFSICNSMKQRVFASGHTHWQQTEATKRAAYVNPGSVGQPRDNNPKAAYAIIKTSGEIILRRVEYDIDCIAKYMKRYEFSPKIYMCLYHGVKIGDN